MTWFAVGGAVIGAAGSIIGGSKAAKAQKKAAKKAAAAQQFNIDRAREDNMPALLARNNALSNMDLLARQYGDKMPTAEEVMAEPGYQFGLTQGRNSLEGSAANAGGLYSGNTGKALQKWGTDYGTTKYGDAFNRMQVSNTNNFNRQASIAGQGQTGANAIEQASTNGANNLSNIYQGAGNAAGAASIANANTYGGLANQLGSIGKSWWNQPGATSANAAGGASSAGFGSGAGFGNLDLGTNFADGGPVTPAAPASAPAVDPALVAKYDQRLNELLAEQRAKQKMGTIAPTTRIEMAEKKALGYAEGGEVGYAPRQRMGIQPYPHMAARRSFAPVNRVQAFADGGPVEPKVGTRAPVREGGGGGMSNSAIVQMLIRQNLERRQGVNPLNPRAVNADREQRANLAGGGQVAGPGGPRDDAIPAQLSNGEHVMDAASVTALGDGDNALGQHRLNQLRAQLKGAC